MNPVDGDLVVRLFVGYDADEDRDYLVTVFDDDAAAVTIATRPGRNQYATTWSAPVLLNEVRDQ